MYFLETIKKYKLRRNPIFMSQRVFVLDKNKKALAPCHPARANELLRKKKAYVYRRFPFTIK